MTCWPSTRPWRDSRSIDERAVRTLELRFFLGCTNQEAAGILHVSRATVDRDLEFAKTWLYGCLHGDTPPKPSAVEPDRKE